MSIDLIDQTPYFEDNYEVDLRQAVLRRETLLRKKGYQREEVTGRLVDRLGNYLVDVPILRYLQQSNGKLHQKAVIRQIQLSNQQQQRVKAANKLVDRLDEDEYDVVDEIKDVYDFEVVESNLDSASSSCLKVTSLIPVQQFVNTSSLKTPLHVVVRSGNLEFVRMKLAEGHISLDSKDADGLSAIHWAAIIGEEELVHLLLSKGCNIYALDKRKNLPLHLAAKYGNTEAVRALLDSQTQGPKKQLKKKNADGFTAIEIAQEYGKIDVFGLLLDRGGKLTIAGKSFHWHRAVEERNGFKYLKHGYLSSSDSDGDTDGSENDSS